MTKKYVNRSPQSDYDLRELLRELRGDVIRSFSRWWLVVCTYVRGSDVNGVVRKFTVGICCELTSIGLWYVHVAHMNAEPRRRVMPLVPCLWISRGSDGV